MANFAIRGLSFEPTLKKEIITDTSGTDFTVDKTGWWYIGGTLAKNVMKPNGEKFIRQSFTSKTDSKSIGSSITDLEHNYSYTYKPTLGGVDTSKLIKKLQGSRRSDLSNNISVYYQDGTLKSGIVSGSSPSAIGTLSLTYLQEV